MAAQVLVVQAAHRHHLRHLPSDSGHLCPGDALHLQGEGHHHHQRLATRRRQEQRSLARQHLLHRQRLDQHRERDRETQVALTGGESGDENEAIHRLHHWRQLPQQTALRRHSRDGGHQRDQPGGTHHPHHHGPGGELHQQHRREHQGQLPRRALGEGNRHQQVSANHQHAYGRPGIPGQYGCLPPLRRKAPHINCESLRQSPRMRDTAHSHEHLAKYLDSESGIQQPQQGHGSGVSV